MRIGYSDEEEYPGQFGLWQGNCQRSLKGRAGQAALRELEAALLALPEKRLIAHKIIDSEGDVCAIGALAKHKGRDILAEPNVGDDDEFEGDGEMEEIGMELGMPRLVAWKVVEKNDIDLDGRDLVTCEGPYRWPSEKPKVWISITPEVRYDRMLAWVRRQLTN